MRRCVISLVLLALVAGRATAQAHPQTREGFWISFGFGYGSLGCEDCNDRTSGGSGYLKMGGTLSQRLLLGGEINGWTKTENDVTLSVSSVGPAIYFYPSATGGFWLKGSLGLATSSLEIGSFSGDETGSSLSLGLGYDARVGTHFALTPYFDISAAHFDGGNVNTFGFGLGFTWP